MPQISRIADPSSRGGHPRTCAPTSQPRCAPIPDHPGRGKRREWTAVPARPPAPLRPGASRSRGRRSLDAAELAAPYARPPRPVRDVRGEAAAYEGVKPRRAERSEGRTMNPRDRPLWYGGRGHYRRAAGPRLGPSGPPARRPRRRRYSAAVNSPDEWAWRSQGTIAPPKSDRGNSGEWRTGSCSRMGGTE